MATRRSKNEEERLDDASIERVIELLEPKEGKPGTKKEACQILGIAYNVTRLAKIIEDYKKAKAREAERRAALRGKPATNDEIVFVISEYLEGATIDSITKSTYRPVNFVKSILEKNAVPIRATSHDYFRPELIPEGAVRDRFAVGERVYSARYDSIAEVEKESKGKNGEWVYRIWLLAEKWKQYAYQPVEELASLEHLRAIGVKV